MKRFIFVVGLFFIIYTIKGQTLISGKVTERDGSILLGATVFLEGTYDGASTNEKGEYEFTTYNKGKFTLLFSYVGYFEERVEVDLNEERIELNIKLKIESKELNSVIFTAGSFEASDKKKGVTLKPLDIVTTPSANGDLYGALRTLPGVQTVGEDGRLFVRGGESYESKTFIDGMLVQKPYSSSTPDIPSSGRFNPFLFNGTLFSSGGYSAEYGQAMSSALILQTNAFPEQSSTSVSVLSVGASLGYTKKWDNTSFSLNYDYVNLHPYYSIVKPDLSWNKAPEKHAGLLTARKRVSKNGLIKFMATASRNLSGIEYPDYNEVGKTVGVDLFNDNFYMNTTFTNQFKNEWLLKAGISYTYNIDKLNYGTENLDDKLNSSQVRIVASKKLFNGVNLKFGGDYIYHSFSSYYSGVVQPNGVELKFQNQIPALFIESEIQLPKKFAARVGLRGEYSDLSDEFKISPRLSLAYKLNLSSQLSIAYGDFYQTAQEEYLKYKNSLKLEAAKHFIVNYQYKKADNTFRIEAYRKNYTNLVKFDGANLHDASTYNNEGKGYATGVDVFWRSNLRKWNLKYWISYSYIDSKRNYRDFLTTAQPTFISNQNVSIVAKKWVNALQTQFGLSYTYASGRTYYNPNSSDFLNDRTGDYNNLCVNVSYLTQIGGNFTIVYFSVSNVLGSKNVYGYHFYNTPNNDGVYESTEIISNQKRFFLLALFLTIK